MKQGSNNRRSRSRGGGKHNYGGGGGGGRNSFESNGPDVKIRGSAQQVQEKYLTLAQDASSSGDWVAAEAYYQFAEHYYRVVNADGNKPAVKVAEQNPEQNPEQNTEQNRDQAKKPVQDNTAKKPDAPKAAVQVSNADAPKDEAEVIDTSPAGLAAAVAKREAEQAEAPKAPKPKPEAAPEKAAS